MERNYKTGGTWTWPSGPQAQTQKGDTTNQYTSGIKNNFKQHYNGQPSAPTCGCEIELQKKRRSECSEYQVGVQIVCQHINDPRSSSSLKTIASNQSTFGPFNPIVVQKNKRWNSVHRRHMKQPQRRMQFTRYDRWQLPSTRSVYAPSPFEQHLAYVESINIQQTHIDDITDTKQILNLEKPD